MHRFAAPCLFAAIAAGAHAQVLASADNGAVMTYVDYYSQQYPLDGTNATLSFKTSKPNEAVIFSFSAARCGIQQTGAQSVTQLNESYIQSFFYLDGALVNTSSGNANTLCYYNQLPQAAYMTQWSGAVEQQRVVVPAPGLHTIGVLVGVGGSFADGTQIFPVFGQTHVEVRH